MSIRVFPGLNPDANAVIASQMVTLAEAPRRAKLSYPGLVVAMVSYAAAYATLHALARHWGDGAVYSLWFPIAGVRFALLWRFGARLALPLALVELAVQATLGAFRALPVAATLIEAAGIVMPVLAYGLGVSLTHALTRRISGLGAAPLPLGLAVIIAPMLAALSSLPWALLDQRAALLTPLLQSAAQLVIFCVGDLLGVMTLAPPLLWGMSYFLDKGAIRFNPPLRQMEAIVMLGLAAASEEVLRQAGLGVRLEPFLLVSIWIGLRMGRLAGWLAGTLVCGGVLLATSTQPDLGQRLGLHMSAAGVAVCAFLAGSYADAERGLRADLRRRDRLLYQADRLKTLRALSVAVIHEIGQPLSLLSIEARHLRTATEQHDLDQDDIRATAALIDRKVEGLSDLVRRLRGFGARSTDDRAPMETSAMVRDALDIVELQARSLAVEIRTDIGQTSRVMGLSIELRQALVNLLLNAINATRGDHIVLRTSNANARFQVEVETPQPHHTAEVGGFGVGLIVARAIIEAHGGRLVDFRRDQSAVYAMILPTLASKAADAA